MINRFGVKPVLCLFAFLFVPAALAGCASAPISMQAEAETSLTTAQLSLRDQANRLAERLDAVGWTVSATPAQATRSFLGRLIGGSEAVAGNAPDQLAVYLDEADFGSVQSDLEGLMTDTRALADQTLIVASLDGNIDASSLERDLAAVERALGAVRRADRFFDAVLEDDSWTEAEEAELEAGLEAAMSATSRLGSAADALAERRWASRSGLFG